MRFVDRIRPVVAKEILQIRRDPAALGLLIGLPALLIILVGYALNFDVRHTPVAYIDWDDSPESRAYIEKFKHTEYFRMTGRIASYREAEEMMMRNKIKLCIVVPERFGRDLFAGRDAAVQLVVDGSDANTGLQAMSNAARITVAHSARIRSEALALPAAGDTLTARAAGVVDLRPRIWYNENLASAKFLIPGLVGLILTLTAVVSTALTVVREKERGTMEQIVVSPLKPFHLIIGKTVPYFGISLIGATLILLIGYALFGIEVEGNLALLYGAIALMILGALGQGLMISSVTDSQQVAFMLAAFSSLLPSFLLSGFVFPIASMPEALQVISNVAVAKFFLVIIRTVMLKGEGFLTVWPEFVALALFAVATLGVSTARLRRRAE
jgi:ABC-2 type transport system permease protein